jgi:hypothetical protein
LPSRRRGLAALLKLALAASLPAAAGPAFAAGRPRKGAKPGPAYAGHPAAQAFVAEVAARRQLDAPG